MVPAITFWQSARKFKTFPPQAGDDRPGAPAHAQMPPSFFGLLSGRATDKVPAGNNRPYGVGKGAV